MSRVVRKPPNKQTYEEKCINLAIARASKKRRRSSQRKTKKLTVKRPRTQQRIKVKGTTIKRKRVFRKPKRKRRKTKILITPIGFDYWVQ